MQKIQHRTLVMNLSNVEKLLKDRDVYYIDKGRDLLVKCLNPEHDDSNPSMRIDSETGKFNCFSCGFHGNVYVHFGEYQSPVHDLVYEVRDRIADIQREARGMEIPDGARPYKEDFRKIKASTYEHFGAFTYGKEEYENRILFPISDATGKIQCFNGRHMYSDVRPKYKIYPERANIPVFPFIPQIDTLILTEGLFDMINLYDKGILNSACTFGTHNLTFSNAYNKLLPYLISGVRRFLVLMDNDKAGRYAAKKMVDIIRLKTKCEAIDISYMLDEGKDPGGLTQKEVDRLGIQIEKLIAR